MDIRRSTIGSAVALAVFSLALPIATLTASATTPTTVSTAFDGVIPTNLNGIALTKAPSFSGADDGISELRNSISTYLGSVGINHTGAFYGRASNDVSDLCYVGCSIGGAEQASSLTFTLPAGTTAFAFRLSPQDGGATTFTVSGSDFASSSFAWGGRGSPTEGAQPTFAVSAFDGSTISQVTITSSQAVGCTFVQMYGPVACYLYGLDITDMAIGDARVAAPTTTTTLDALGLPRTGGNPIAIVVVGWSLFVVGVGVTAVVRRRRI